MPSYFPPDLSLGLHLEDMTRPSEAISHSMLSPSGLGGGWSSSTDQSTLARTPTDEFDITHYDLLAAHDQSVRAGSGSLSSGSGGDDFKGFFNDLHLDGLYPQRPPSTSLSPTHKPMDLHAHAPLSPHSYSSSAPTLSYLAPNAEGAVPSPFLYGRQDGPFHQPRLGPGWDSVNPFAADGEFDGHPSGTPYPGTFALVKSNEDARTPQACQACRARKSKCDGLKSCSRCVNRGIACVYVVRSPRVRAPKRIPVQPERAPSAVSLSSCFTSEPLVHRPQSTPTRPGTATDSANRARRRSSDTALGVVDRRGSLARRDSDLRAAPVGVDMASRRPSRKVDHTARTVEVAGWEADYPASGSYRRRSMADPYPTSPHEVLTSTFGQGAPWGVPSAFDYSPSAHALSVSYPNAHLYGPQTFQPHPAAPYSLAPPPPTTPQQQQSIKQHPRHSIAQPVPPTPTSTYPIEYQLPSSPVGYFAPIPTGVPAYHAPAPAAEGGYYPGRPPAYAAVVEPQTQYYSSPPMIQPRRSSMPSFRPPPAAASPLGLYKARGRPAVEMVHEEVEHARPVQVQDAGAWEELSYNVRR